MQKVLGMVAFAVISLTLPNSPWPKARRKAKLGQRNTRK